MKTLAKRAIWILTCVYILALVAATVLPSGTDTFGGWDLAFTPALQNILHVPAYALLAILVSLSLSRSHKLGGWRILWIGLACYALSCLLEFLQAAIPGRIASLTDTLLNLCGVVVGCLALMCWPGIVRGRIPSVKAVSSKHQPEDCEG